MKKKPDLIVFPKGTLVKINALPFKLRSDTIVEGRVENLKVINQKSLGLVSRFQDDQSDDLITM